MWEQYGWSNFLIFNIVEYVEVVERNIAWKFFGETAENIGTYFPKPVPTSNLKRYSRLRINDV